MIRVTSLFRRLFRVMRLDSPAQLWSIEILCFDVGEILSICQLYHICPPLSRTTTVTYITFSFQRYELVIRSMQSMGSIWYFIPHHIFQNTACPYFTCISITTKLLNFLNFIASILCYF